MAAIKRSQANQRRNPDTFHFYQSYNHPQSPATAAVKVDLSHLLLAILDDPLVSRVFADAGFRSADIKLAILRPAPPMPLLGRLPARARPPPLFLCSFAAADDADVSSPAGSLAGAGAGEDNSRRIAEILSRGRNPMLVGVGAASAADEFAAASPYRILHVGPNSINQTDLTRFAAATATGLIISIGDLKDLVPDDEAAILEENQRRVVSEVTRLLETHRPPAAHRVWVMGWSATYETYLAFLSKFPLLDKDWDLQLLPVTAVRSAPATTSAAAPLLSMPPATTPTPTTSLVESYAPFGGFFGEACEVSSLTANSCQQCNDRYEQEVATIIKGSGITVEDNHQGGLPSLLQNGSMMGPNSGFDAVKVRGDQMVLKSKILNLQKKWNEYCLRLHQGCQRINKDPYQLFPHYVGVPAGKETTTNASNDPEAIAPQREVIRPCDVSTLYTNTTAKSISSPSISNQRNDGLELKLQVRQSKSDEHFQDRGVQSQHRNSSNCDDYGDRASPSSTGPVATELVLGTPRECSLKVSSSAWCRHVEDADRSVNLTPRKVDDSNPKPAQLFVPPYTCSRSLINSGQTSPGALHSAPSGGNSAFGQWQRPSPLSTQSSDMSNYKLLVERLFKAVGRQEEALSAICQSIVQRRSMDRRHGANKRNDIWFSFYGPDSIAKRRVAVTLAELMHGSSDNLIYLDLSHQDWGDSNFRGKTGTDCIVEELRKKRQSVIFLDNIDKADCLVQDSLSRAIELGRFDWQGRMVDLNNSIVILSTRMTRKCKNASLGMEEGLAFSEEKVMTARGHQLKISVEPDAGNITGGLGGKVVVCSGHSVTRILCSGSVSKRKLNISDGQEMIQDSPSTSKRLHRTSSMPFDLNLPLDEDEARDADDDSSSCENSSGNPDGSVENLLHLVDESIDFKPFNFDKLCEDMLQEFSSIISKILGSDCRLEIHVAAMEQILAAAWASDSEKRPVRTWLEQVFARSLEELKLKCKNVINSTVRLVACEDILLKDEGFGALLPSRIILGW